MSDNVIDTIIAEASQAQSEAPEIKVDEQKPAEEVATDDQKDTTDEKAVDNDDAVPFPKKAVNAITRRDRQIGKLRAELAALRAAQPAQVQNQNKPQPVKDGPSEDDFENYGDYLIAKAKHEISQEMALKAEEGKKQQVDVERQNWVAQREEAIVTTMETHKKAIPDFEDVIRENVDIADEFPEAIAQAFYEADDAALAFYNLAKEGKLEALATMSPYKAAMEIAMAQMKKPQVNKISSAPSPIRSATGATRTAKRLEDMSGEELIKHLNIK